MKCPFCQTHDTSVIDSRLGKDFDAVRRRRQCDACCKRFTTYERVEELLPLVVKKDGRREAFDRLKILNGLKRACEKRPIDIETLEQVISSVEHHFQISGEKEVPSFKVGEEIMRQLKELDQVAYVRFASVYRSFKDISEFMNELSKLSELNK